GGGELAGQVLGGLTEEGGPSRVEYHAVDARLTRHPSPSPMERGDGDRGAEALATTAGIARHNMGLRWWSSLDALREAGIKAHCVVSNEFFDALPVHRVAWLDGRLKEIYVDWGERGFVERVGDPSDDALARWIVDGGIVPPEGWRGEICLRLMAIVEVLSEIVGRGVMLSIDYGYETADFFDPRHAA